MPILIKTFIFKYISWFICGDMGLLYAIIQTAGLRKSEKGIWIKSEPYDHNKEMRRKDKSALCFSFFSVHMSDCSSGMCPLPSKGLRGPLQKSGVSGPSWAVVGRAPTRRAGPCVCGFLFTSTSEALSCCFQILARNKLPKPPTSSSKFSQILSFPEYYFGVELLKLHKGAQNFTLTF